MTTQLSASKGALASHCLYPFAPGSLTAEDGTNPPQRLGNAFHSAAQRTIDHEPVDLVAIAAEEGCEEIDELRALYETWRRDITPRLGWRAEVAIAYDPATRTARELGRNIGRKYAEHGAREGELCMSVDVMTMGSDLAGPYVEIRDHKTGRQANAEHIDDHTQLRINGLGVSLVTGWTRVRTLLDHITPDGVFTSEAWLDELDLSLVADDIDAWIAGIPDAAPAPGPWCSEQYCDAQAECPATHEAIAQIIPPEQLTRWKLGQPIETAPHADMTIVAVGMLRAAADELEKRARTFADERGGFLRADGKLYRKWPKSSRSIDLGAPGAFAVLEAHEAGGSVEAKTSIAAIERQIGKKAAVAVLAQLSEIGAVRVSQFGKYEARKAEK